MKAPLLAAAVLTLSLSAFAQEFELDLSAPAKEEPKKEAPKAEPKREPKKEAEPPKAAAADDLELDLSAPVEQVDPALRPVLVIAGVQGPSDSDDAVTAARARLVEQELVRLANEGDRFKTVIEPQLAASQTGAGPAPRSCTDWACFEKVTRALKGQRMVVAEVKKSGAGSSIALALYDPGFSELLPVTIDSGERAEKAFAGMGTKTQAQKDREFLRKISPLLSAALDKLATPNGKLVIDNMDGSVAVVIDGAEAGLGSFEAIVQRGPHTVRITAAGYLPFEQTVTVPPKESASVKVMLVARPLEPPKVVVKEESSSVFSRPGLYVALAGVAAVGAGVAIGLGAKSVEARAGQLNADGLSPVTRAQAKGAQGQALLANILVGAGAAAVAGGTVWVILTPTGPKPTVDAPPSDATPGGGFGVMLSAGGSF